MKPSCQCRQSDAGTYGKPLFVGKRLLVCGALEDDYLVNWPSWHKA